MSTVEKTELTEKPAFPVHHDNGPLASILDTDLFNHLWRVATAYSRSAMVPDVFRGKPDDCFVAVQLALRLEVDPFMLMQSMYVVHGRPGMEAKLAIALANSRGPFSDRIDWKFHGEGMERSCTAFAHDKATGNLCECTVSMAVAKAEGWIDKNGSKWRTMPDQMLKYRSAAWLIRTTCPEVLMGMSTTDELHDITIDARPTGKLDQLLTAETTPAGPPEPTHDARPEADQPAAEGASTGEPAVSPPPPPSAAATAVEFDADLWVQDFIGQIPHCTRLRQKKEHEDVLHKWRERIGETLFTECQRAMRNAGWLVQ
jgi:hypothetical protein